MDFTILQLSLGCSFTSEILSLHQLIDIDGLSVLTELNMGKWRNTCYGKFGEIKAKLSF